MSNTRIFNRDQTLPEISFDSKGMALLFLFWPFLAFLVAVKNYADKDSRKTIYMFFIYYGLTLVISHEGLDVARHALHLEETAMLPFSDFFKIVFGLNATNTSLDIVQPFIAFIVSRFTISHGVMFAVYAAIFGYFYLKSIDLLHFRYRQNPNGNAFVHLIFFVTILPITSIAGFRMGTAAWIFFYGAYHAILYKNPRFLLIAFSSSLVHFSFLSANLVLAIYYFAGNRNIIYLPLAILSFIAPNLLSSIFEVVSDMLGAGLHGHYELYTSEGYVLQRQEMYEQSAWFMRYGFDIVLYSLLTTIIIIQIKQRNSIKENEDKNLFSFLLLFIAFVNFGKGIPSFGDRFQIVFFLFATTYIFLYYINSPDNSFKPITWIGMIPMFLYLAIIFRINSETINAWIFAPGFGIPLLIQDINIYELIF